MLLICVGRETACSAFSEVGAEGLLFHSLVLPDFFIIHHSPLCKMDINPTSPHQLTTVFLCEKMAICIKVWPGKMVIQSRLLT